MMVNVMGASVGTRNGQRSSSPSSTGELARRSHRSRVTCRVHRYYDPTTGQFLTVDPLVAQTNQPFSYANDDPVNGSDPSGLHDCGWTDPEGCVANAGADTAHFVATHKKAIEVGAGIALGVAAAATGVGAIVEGSVLLAGVSVTAGFGASALDYGPCMSGNRAGCVGLGLGVTGAVAGGFGLAGAGLVAGGFIAADSTAAGILGGLGVFGWNVGIAGTIVDATTGIASADSLCGIEA
jgi:RHS repeat-associated protein